jgi:hypothetical protein
MSYEGEKDIEVKMCNVLKVTGLTTTVSKPSGVQQHTRIKNYNILALTTLSHDSKFWVMAAKDKKKKQN